MTRIIPCVLVALAALSGCGTKTSKEVYEFWQMKQMRECVRKARDEFDLQLCAEIDDVSHLEYEKMKQEAERDR